MIGGKWKNKTLGKGEFVELVHNLEKRGYKALLRGNVFTSKGRLLGIQLWVKVPHEEKVKKLRNLI